MLHVSGRCARRPGRRSGHIYKGIPGASFRAEASAKTWLCRIALNVCKSYLRRRRAVPTDALPETAVYDSYDEDGEVVRAVAALPEKYKSVVLLRFFRELSTKEAAYALGISESAVSTRLSRAMAMLRERLGDNYNEGY